LNNFVLSFRSHSQHLYSSAKILYCYRARKSLFNPPPLSAFTFVTILPCPGHHTIMGYAEIAKLMGKHPEVAIFRRFAFLNTKNLLYLQAELMVLEDELNDLIKEDIERETEESKTKPKTDIVIPDRDWEDLTKAPAQWQKFKDIRKKLKEYSKSASLQLRILMLN
jgi:hypothetical protein